MGVNSETSPDIKPITPKAVAIPDTDLYLAINFCLLTLSNPKVNPHRKRIEPAKNGFPIIVKRIIMGDVTKIWKANAISPLYLSTILPLGNCPKNMPKLREPSIKLMAGRENSNISRA